MNILISGSLAYDTILTFEGRFADPLKAQSLTHLNLTFPISHMREALGGCAANIATTLHRLQANALIWTAVGHDATAYLHHLKAQGLSTDCILVLNDAQTSRCIITVDALGNQLSNFYAGAMDRSHEVPWPTDRAIDLVHLAPGSPHVMLTHADLAYTHGVPYFVDLGQSAPLFNRDQLHQLYAHAHYAAFSDYEADLIKPLGIDAKSLSQQGIVTYQTHGARGASVWLPYQTAPLHIAARTVQAVDPVGAGDAFRAGLLKGLTLGLNPVQAGQLGSLVASQKVQYPSAQDFPLDWAELQALYQALYHDTLPEAT